MPLYTKEQIENANRISLVEYLRLKGEKLKRTGNEYKWIYTDSQGEHCSVSINENKWYDHKNETGGYTVSFLQEFYGLTFPEAMHELLDGESPKLCTTVQGDSGKKQKPDFVLPPRAKNMKRLFGYLIKKRFISSEVIKFFAEQKLIYQEAEHGNIVFVGMDEKGKPVSACLKSVSEQYRHFKVTVEGSDMRYGFCYRGTGEKLFVFEAAVDLLSYLTLYPENWKEQSYLALDGLSPKALLQFVNTQKNIKSVYICVDYDTAGIEAWDKFKDLLLENGYKPEQVNRILPMYKDWNEILKEQNGEVPILPQLHPKTECYKRVTRNLCILNAKTESGYTKWKLQGIEKYGIEFLLRRIHTELKPLKSVLHGDEMSKECGSSTARIADMAISALCELEKAEGNSLPQPTVYCRIAGELYDGYKPYLDRMKSKRRCEDLEKETGAVFDAFQKHSPSFFCCLKQLADSAIRLKVYMETDYQLELERRQKVPTENKREEDEAVCQIGLSQ